MNRVNNIFSAIPDDIPEELFQDILKTDSFKIERIVSKGHASPEGFWYNQKHHEWVILVKGGAGLRFENDDHLIEMKPGDYIHIPAHVKHRVEYTDPDAETVWIAVRY